MTRFRSRTLAALAVLAVALVAHDTAEAGAILTFQEVGGDVLVTGSGTIDLAALVFNSTMVIPPAVSPSGRYFAVGPGGSIDFYGGTIGPTGFGPGGFTPASFGAGDMLGISVGFVAVPAGYVSGTALSGSAAFTGQSFASLGLNPGTYGFTWGSGQTADSLTLQVGPAASVPEPTAITLFGTATFVLAGYVRRRGRRRG